MQPPSPLEHMIAAETARPASPAVAALVQALQRRLGPALAAIVYYGACLREGGEEEGLIDLYALVDDYRRAYRRRAPALANRLLPPNVYYLEVALGVRTVRAKYAVMSLPAFQHAVSRRCFQSAFWARFAQPCALVHARDDAAATTVRAALATAMCTFLERALPLAAAEIDALDPWRAGLAASYRTELRPEAPETAATRLVAAAPARYRAASALVLPQMAGVTPLAGAPGRFRVELTRAARARARAAWRLRRLQGKTLNLLRLAKALFTFDGGVAYALWKIERHAGVRVPPSALLARHPWLQLGATLWRLRRRREAR